AGVPHFRRDSAVESADTTALATAVRPSTCVGRLPAEQHADHSQHCAARCVPVHADGDAAVRQLAERYRRETRMSTDKPTSKSRRQFVATGSVLGAAGMLWAALPFAGNTGRTFAATRGGNMSADTILFNGRVHTVDRENPQASAVAIKDGRFLAVGDDATVMATRGDATQIIDLKRRCVIPGLNDSHLHLIRGGLNYNLELRWEGVPSLADALRMLKEQADRTPTPQWVRVVGGWTEFQFTEKRLPTLDELNR